MPAESWKIKKGLEYADLIARYKVEFPYFSETQLAKIIIKREKLPHTVGTFRTIVPYARKKITDTSLDDTEFNIEIPDPNYEQRKPFINPAYR
jgi:hypothetical protein